MSIEKIDYLHFHIGGYHSSNNVDIKLKNGVLTYWKSYYPFVEEGQIQNKIVEAHMIERLMAGLNQQEVVRWKKKYEMEMDDGIQWTLDLLYNRRQIKRIYGSNQYPENFDQVLSILEEFVGESLFESEEGDEEE